MEAYWEACERWADEQLSDPASAEEAQKGAPREPESEIAQEIETLLGPQALAELDFEAVEMSARRQALRLAARALEQRLNADTSDQPDWNYLAPAATGPVSGPPREDV